MSLFRHTGTVKNSIATLTVDPGRAGEGGVDPSQLRAEGHAKGYLVPLEAVLMAAWTRLSRPPVVHWANAGGNFGPIHVFLPSDGDIAWLP
jgi:hypothetical protein